MESGSCHSGWPIELKAALLPPGAAMDTCGTAFEVEAPKNDFDTCEPDEYVLLAKINFKC